MVAERPLAVFFYDVMRTSADVGSQAGAFELMREVGLRVHDDNRIVEDVGAFSVVKEQYSKHADILRNSVMHWTRDGYHFFVMQDPIAVEQGATRLENTDLVLGL